MARVTAPLLSFGASGQVAKSQVYSRWRGISYVRRHVVPSNPQTLEQNLTRNIFAAMSSMWANAPAAMIAAWNLQAQGKPYTGRNQFMGMNTRLLRSATSLADLITSPGALSGIAPAGLTATNNTGTGTVDATVDVPSAPTGWTATMIHGIALADKNPPSAWEPPIVYASTDPLTPTLSFEGLDTAEPNVVSVWIEWQRPDGRTAYGRSLTTIAS